MSYILFKSIGDLSPRSPLVMEMQYGGEEFIIIDNHLKAMGDGYINLSDPWDKETLRYDACNLLHEWIKNYAENEQVIILGSLNNMLTDDEENNVFISFLEDENHYYFTDMEIALGNCSDWSYPGWSSHLDHILFSDELYEEFADPQAKIVVIEVDDYIDGGWNSYDYWISDHRPVALKLSITGDTGGSGICVPVVNSWNYPNPFNKTTIYLVVSRNEYVSEFEIFNIKGQKVRTLSVSGDHVVWDALDDNGIPAGNGLNFYRADSDHHVFTRRMLLLR